DRRTFEVVAGIALHPCADPAESALDDARREPLAPAAIGRRRGVRQAQNLERARAIGQAADKTAFRKPPGNIIHCIPTSAVLAWPLAFPQGIITQKITFWAWSAGFLNPNVAS